MKLSTGKLIDGNRGIIGLEWPEMKVFGGYDDFFPCETDDDLDEDREDVLTKSEAVELADVMIARWAAFRAKNLA